MISAGLAVQFLGLIGDSWMNDPQGSGGGAILSFSDPSHVLLVLGMGLTVVGALLGLFGQARALAQENGHTPRLLPLLPLVLLAGLAVGGGAFAYQAGDDQAGTTASATADNLPAPFVVASPGPEDCQPGTVWHPQMGHCMTPAAIAALDQAQTCPDGYTWLPTAAYCAPVQDTSIVPGAGVTSPGATPVCPAGFFWHVDMNHCMALSVAGPTSPTGGGAPVCPAGSFWHEAMQHCMPLVVETPSPGATPACPSGMVWHPAMNGCMSTVCPTGYEWDATTFTCDARPASTTPTPTPVPTTPAPGSTVTPPPDVTPTPTPDQSCPEGYFWHPAMGHCMSTTCPPGLEWDPVTWYCVLPPELSATPTVTPPPDVTPTPTRDQSCPEGYFWHPAMGHCMSTTCPPGLEWDPVTWYCVLPPDLIVTPTATL